MIDSLPPAFFWFIVTMMGWCFISIVQSMLQWNARSQRRAYRRYLRKIKANS